MSAVSNKDVRNAQKALTKKRKRTAPHHEHNVKDKRRADIPVIVEENIEENLVLSSGDVHQTRDSSTSKVRKGYDASGGAFKMPRLGVGGTVEFPTHCLAPACKNSIEQVYCGQCGGRAYVKCWHTSNFASTCFGCDIRLCKECTMRYQCEVCGDNRAHCKACLVHGCRKHQGVSMHGHSQPPSNTKTRYYCKHHHVALKDHCVGCEIQEDIKLSAPSEKQTILKYVFKKYRK